MPQAKAGMALLAANIARISPETNKDWRVTVEPLRDAHGAEDFIGARLRRTLDAQRFYTIMAVVLRGDPPPTSGHTSRPRTGVSEWLWMPGSPRCRHAADRSAREKRSPGPSSS
jgi:hypothetical protein